MSLPGSGGVTSTATARPSPFDTRNTGILDPTLDDVTQHVSQMFTTPELADPFPQFGKGLNAWQGMTNGAETQGSGSGSAAPTHDPMNGFNLTGWETQQKNGYIPDAAMAHVGNTQFLMEPHAAAAMGAMIQAAKADGVSLSIGESYRSYASQASAYASYQAGTHPAPVAAPGTSNHGWGLAVDFIITAQNHAWLVANASRFGYSDPFGNSYNATENWHWEYGQNGFSPSYGSTTAGSPAGAGKPSTPQPEARPTSPLYSTGPATAVQYGAQPDLIQVVTALNKLQRKG